MTLQDFEYLQTLGYFLDHSDEDEIDAEYIVRFLRERELNWTSNGDPAGWLDVGTGPATKVVAVLRKWLASGHRDLPSLTLVEPSTGWRARARGAIVNAGFKDLIATIAPLTWELFVSGNHPVRCFRLVTFLHSVYGMRLDDAGGLAGLAALPQLLDPQGWAAFAIESPASDLYSMKQMLFPHFEFCLVDYAVLESTFDRFGWDYVRMQDLPQKFYLSEGSAAKREALANTRALSFIVQTTPDSYDRRLSSPELDMIREQLSAHLKRDASGWYLNVHDRIYWTQCKPHHAKRA